MQAVSFDWQLIVVDNAGDDSTQRTCKEYQSQLPLLYMVCAQPGKNAALNQGLQHATGELIVFTDDDVLPDANWLAAMREGASRWPNHVLFGGRVLPHWPSEPPDFVMQFASNAEQGRWTYGVLNPKFDEGPNPTLLPLGANMAVRRTLFDNGMRFNETIGPNGMSYAMGSETELNLRLRSQGHNAVYLPKSSVYHQIRPEQMTVEWIISRAFREGRGEARLKADFSVHAALRLAKNAVGAYARYYGAIVRGQHAPVAALQVRRSLATGRLYETVRMAFQRKQT
jgi:GT2 family glycosyltransferase